MPVAIYIRSRPRSASALMFGAVTMAVQYFAWIPEARLSGLAPALTIAAGLAHAIAAAITGPRLLDPKRTRTASQAGLLGACTSLLALATFAPLFAASLFAKDPHPASPLAYLMMSFLVAVFAFLGAGWALLLVSIGIGWVLHRVAAGSTKG